MPRPRRRGATAQNDAEPSAYEKEREDNINRNKRRMEELVQSSSVDTPPKDGHGSLAGLAPPGKRSRPARNDCSTRKGGDREREGLRRSSRVREVAEERLGRSGNQRAAGQRDANGAAKRALAEGRTLKNSGAGPPPPGADAPFGGRRYTKLSSSGQGSGPLPKVEPSEGKRDKKGRLVFKDAPDFRPNLAPAEMIRLGIFGGCYFNPRGGRPGIFGRVIAVDHQEYPKEWFDGLPPHMYINRRYDVSLNRYKVKAGQDQAFWERKGWIHEQDPRGWFQWFYLGRRTEDDKRQISRWKGVAGLKGRWKNALCNKIIASGDITKHVDNPQISPVIRQTLLHWAYHLTFEDLEQHAKRHK